MKSLRKRKRKIRKCWVGVLEVRVGSVIRARWGPEFPISTKFNPKIWRVIRPSKWKFARLPCSMTKGPKRTPTSKSTTIHNNSPLISPKRTNSPGTSTCKNNRSSIQPKMTCTYFIVNFMRKKGDGCLGSLTYQ